MQGYGQDLAYIHDAGFSDYTRSAAPGLLAILRKHGVADGLVVDLGCGSGRWARELNRAGYRVLGVDQSSNMIRMARRIAPRSKFQVASLLSVKLPACDAITSIGECFNYCFDQRNSVVQMRRLFRRVYQALRPGGVFVFDTAEPGRIPKQPEKKWMAGRDWVVLVSINGDKKRETLQRQIVSFRKIGKQYRRSEEIHNLQLYRTTDLIKDLTSCGFRARKLTGYGDFQFPAGIAGVLAMKTAPSRSRLRKEPIP
ncbi:MAG TPA: class I SAM-dependent methyltransferase [Bryobacteraceae bacterium]|nr:class I SAM-dependent methyltransferase [Bryobacteraceae bacterium]